MNQFLNITIMIKEISIKKSKITITIRIVNIILFYHQNYILRIISINSKNNKSNHYAINK